jgi:hypothetical protein
VASQTGLHDAWTWTAGVGSNQFQSAIASYNIPAGSLPPGLGPDRNMDVATLAAQSAMMR